MNTTAHEDRVDSIIGSLEGFAHDEYGNNLHALLDDGHTARGLIEDACYWRGWPYTQQLIADTLAAARTLADTADDPAPATITHPTFDTVAVIRDAEDITIEIDPGADGRCPVELHCGSVEVAVNALTYWVSDRAEAAEAVRVLHAAVDAHMR